MLSTRVLKEAGCRLAAVSAAQRAGPRGRAQGGWRRIQELSAPLLEEAGWKVAAVRSLVRPSCRKRGGGCLHKGREQGGRVALGCRLHSRGKGAGCRGLLGSGMETHLNGRMMDMPRRMRRSLVIIVAQTGATTSAEVAAHGLAAPSTVWRILLRSNFHSSHLPRPSLPTLPTLPRPRWKSPMTCLPPGQKGGG